METQKRKNHDQKSNNVKVQKLHDIKDENLKKVDKFETKYFIKTGFQSNCRLILDQAGSVIVYQPRFFIHHQSELLQGIENNIKTIIIFFAHFCWIYFSKLPTITSRSFRSSFWWWGDQRSRAHTNIRESYLLINGRFVEIMRIWKVYARRNI